MDPLSDVLALLRPRSSVSAGFAAAGDWSLRFADQHGRIKCYAVVAGSCWLQVEDGPAPVRLRAGECFVLPSGRPFRLASDLALEPRDSSTLFPPAQPGGVVSVNGGGEFLLVGSRFALAGTQAAVLLRTLPAIMQVSGDGDRAALLWAVERMRQELREAQPGSALVAEHLAHMMLVQVLRLHLADRAGQAVGWFYALADRQIGAALTALHADPARRWTVADLARLAGLSRSGFALKFRALVGETPMDYLAQWRMLLAADRLATTAQPVSAIALSLGYDSESAFSTAFRRIMGCSPRQHARPRDAAQPGPAPARGYAAEL